MMSRRVLCFDLGASGGRAILAGYNSIEKRIELEEVYRFRNRGVEVNGTMYWDILSIYSELRIGLVKAHKAGGFCSVGIDTWGVDQGILDSVGQLIGEPVQYRDSRTKGMVRKAEQYISKEKLYSLTGNQIMEINTAFQLLAEKEKRPYTLENGAAMLNIPDLLGYMLTGEISSEESIASTTQLFDPLKRQWSEDVIRALRLPERLFRDIIPAGSRKGTLRPEICSELNIPPSDVTTVCGHDTQCAFYAAPAGGPDSIIISSGTWSLVGIVSDSPITTSKAAELNITNESGADGTTDILKNITGLWLVQETKAFLETRGESYSFSDLENAARAYSGEVSLIDPDAPEFSTAGDIPERIRTFCRRTGQKVPENIGAVMKCIYLSLAMKYRYAIDQLRELTGKNGFKVINMVGGGIQDKLLCSMTADVCGIEVIAGPVEATALGNAMIQLISCGEIENASERMEILNNTCISMGELSRYSPQTDYDDKYIEFKKIIKEF